jgi:hypothetical protein
VVLLIKFGNNDIFIDNMNSTYTLNEGNEALNRVLLMMRYDLSKTLSENIVIEQPDSKFDTPYNKEFMRKYKPSQTMTFDEFMEDYRKTLTHPVMIGLETFLLSTGVGGLGVSAAYAILLIYDIYKGITTGDWEWFEIIFNTLAIISAGALTKILRPYVNSLRKLKFNSLDEVFTYLSKTKLWSKIKGFLQSGLNVLTKLSESIGDIFKWMSEKTGFKFVKNISSKVQGVLKTIINSIGKILKGVGKMVTEPLSVVGKKQAAKRAIQYGGAAYSLNLINDYLEKTGSDEIIRGKDEFSDDFMNKLFDNNKNYFTKKIDKIIFIETSDDEPAKMKINGNTYVMTDYENNKVKKI